MSNPIIRARIRKRDLFEAVLAVNALGIHSMNSNGMIAAMSSFQVGLDFLLPPDEGGSPANESAECEGTSSGANGGCKMEQCSASNFRIEMDQKPKISVQPHNALPLPASQHCRQPGPERMVTSIPILSQSKQSSQEHDDIFVLFARALHVPCSYQTLVNFDDRLQDPVPFLVGILLYNIGLCYHLLGLQVTDHMLLSRALDFYSMSYTTLVNQSSTSQSPSAEGTQSPQEVPSTVEAAAHNSTFAQPENIQDATHNTDFTETYNLAYLALANNVGHIHAWFRNLPQVEICSREIISRLQPTTMSLPQTQVLENSQGTQRHAEGEFSFGAYHSDDDTISVSSSSSSMDTDLDLDDHFYQPPSEHVFARQPMSLQHPVVPSIAPQVSDDEQKIFLLNACFFKEACFFSAPCA